MGHVDEARRTATAPDADTEMDAQEVLARFAWARRQGRPAWLWPDIQINAWRSAMAEIEGVVAAVLAGDQGATLQGDAQSLGLAGYTSGVGPLLGAWLEQGRLVATEPVAAVLARHLAHNRIRAQRMAGAAGEIVERLADRGIETLVLKGAHTGLTYFPEPGARPASDIDLLVAAADEAAAKTVMASLGLALKEHGQWESTWVPAGARREPRSLIYVHADDPWSIDLHTALKVCVGRGTPLADLDRVWPMAGEELWPADPRAHVLDQPLLLLHLAAHAGAGWQNLTLLRQVELVLVIRQDLAGGRLSWSEFLKVGARTGALGYAYPALRVADQLAPRIVPPQVLAACATEAPAAVRLALDGLTPATVHRIDRMSLSEHFMWAPGWRGRARQLAADIVPQVRSWSELRRVYEERVWRLIRGTVSH